MLELQCHTHIAQDIDTVHVACTTLIQHMHMKQPGFNFGFSDDDVKGARLLYSDTLNNTAIPVRWQLLLKPRPSSELAWCLNLTRAYEYSSAGQQQA